MRVDQINPTEWQEQTLGDLYYKMPWSEGLEEVSLAKQKSQSPLENKLLEMIFFHVMIVFFLF